MPRRRLGLAILLPPEIDAELRGLRRAVGDPALRRVPSHITLVPPVNVRDDDLWEALANLRRAAAVQEPFRVEIGPAALFGPAGPVLHLQVIDATERLAPLRASVFKPPLQRDTRWSFTPHVTLVDGLPPERAAAAVMALADYWVEVEIDRFYLLEERRHGHLHRQWHSAAEFPFGPPVIVGRGGLELELTITSIGGPDVDRFLAEELGDGSELVGVELPPPEARSVVVAARREGRLVGVAAGWSGCGTSELWGVLVAREERGLGVGYHLSRWFDVAASEDG